MSQTLRRSAPSGGNPDQFTFIIIQLDFAFSDYSGVFGEDQCKAFVDTALTFAHLEQVIFSLKTDVEASKFVAANLAAIRTLHNAGKLGLWSCGRSSYRLVIKVCPHCLSNRTMIADL